MTMMIFSDPRHVTKIWQGTKPQTTRLPRKIPVKEGDILHCYFRSRMAKTCLNCIKRDCETSVLVGEPHIPGTTCSLHTNFIGVATVRKVSRVRFIELNSTQKESWAILDGFGSFAEADQWFIKAHEDDWQEHELDVIMFEGHWLMKPSAETCAPCKNFIPITKDPGTWETDNTCQLRELSVWNMQKCPLMIGAGEWRQRMS